MWLFWLWFIVYGPCNSVCVSMFCGCYCTGALWVIQSFWTQRDLCRVNGMACCCGCNGGRVLRWTACWMFTENSSPGTLRERWLFWDGSDNTMPVFSIEEEWLWWNGMEKWPGIELISEHQKGPASNSHTLFLVLFVRKSQWAYVNEMMNIRISLSGCQATQSFDATQWCHCGMQELLTCSDWCCQSRSTERLRRMRRHHWPECHWVGSVLLPGAAVELLPFPSAAL